MKHPSRILLTLLTAMSVASTTRAATISWTGASGTDTNWSNAANWNGGLPTSADDVKFFDTGSNGTAATPNNLVDGAFVGPIGSLQYGNTNGFHTTFIAPGTTLTVNGGLSVMTPADPGTAKTLHETITGIDGTLTLNNAAANLVLNQGNGTANSSRSILDLSGLGNFNATLSRIGLGTTVLPNPSGNQRMSGTLFLARTNVIALSYTDTLANYQLAGRTNALEMVRHPGNNANVQSLIHLGITNTILVDSMGFGRDKASSGSAATMLFNAAFTNLNPVAFIRGAAGGSSRVTWWSLGDMNASASSAQVSVGTNDFSNGTVDAMVDVLSLGRDCSPNHTASASIIGTLTFNAGTIDANTIYAGNQSLGPNTSSAPNLGFINVNGSATLRVNNDLVLGRTVQTTGAGAGKFSTRGVLNIRNGTVQANNISAGTVSTNNTITIADGTLVVTNTAGTLAKGITTITATNSTLQLAVTGANNPNVVVTNLVTGGAGNTISVPTVAVFASYPTQFTLVKYTGSIGGAGYNFSLGAISGAAPGAYLSNNVLNTSIDLVLPTDPKPTITSLPNSYGGSPGDNVTLTAGYSGSSPITLQWTKDGTNITDGATGSGSTISGATTASVTVTSAQETDSGAYAIVVSNPYGSVTSTPPASLIISTNDIAPIISGPNNLTVVQGNNATFTTSVSGKPVPTVQWYKDGAELTGETSANLTILNAQYPADQATYSIVASNTAGMTTNSATLTVIVAPVIAVQPTSLVVTNTQAAAFTVVSTNGVPAVTYQWKKNGGNITDATNATLSFASAAPSDTASYTVLIANAAGSALSDPATLTVNSTMTANTLTPANSATGVHYDTPLSITFSVAPTLRTAGTIKIYNVTNLVTPVDIIDLSLGNSQQRLFPGDGQSFTYNVVNISGNTAKIFPHFNVMTSNQTYFVTVDNGVFADSAGAYFAGITDSNTWQFTTKSAPADPNNVVVAANGSGDFLTVQGAVNSIASGNTTPRVINIRNGDYNEIVNTSGKHNITFRGESRTGVVVGGTNNATFQAANSGTTHARMAFKVNANDIAVDTLTITNRTPQGGSQAEALMMSTGARRFIANNVNIASRQDTILANQNSSQGYFNNSTIIGNFDYIWGGGNLFFTNCNVHNISGTGSGNVTAARTDFGASAATGNWMTPDGLRWSSNGFSFVGCVMTADPGVVNITLAGNNGTAGGLSSWINCRFATNAYIAPGAGLASSFNFWQYQNTELTGVAPVTYANVVTLTGGDPRLLAAQDAVVWLNGWTPQLAPNILTQPASQSVLQGQPASFTVVATGVPEASYQWLQNGTNAPFPSANSATLSIPSAQPADAAIYSVIVSNTAGAVTSSSVNLTVAPLVSPTLSNFTVLGDGNFQFNATGGSGQPYRVWASTNVALTPITSTWTLLSSGTFGGSPLIFTDTQATNFAQRFYLLTVP